MPSTSLSDFPVEVLIQVYESLDNVTDITVLNLTTYQHYNVWLSNTVLISTTVLSCTT